jgi:hypothetical protein
MLGLAFYYVWKTFASSHHFSKMEVWAHETSFIEVSVSSQESEWSCIFAVDVSILSLSMIFL